MGFMGKKNGCVGNRSHELEAAFVSGRQRFGY